MMLKYVLGSALAVVVAAHSGSSSSYVPAGLCSGPCPAQSKEALALVQRHASTLPSLDVDVTNEAEDQQTTEMAMKDLEIQKRIEDKHTAMRGIAKIEEKHKEKQDIVKLEKNIAKQKDLVNKQIEDKHEAKQFIVKLEKQLAEQKSEEKDYAQASSLQRSYQEAKDGTWTLKLEGTRFTQTKWETVVVQGGASETWTIVSRETDFCRSGYDSRQLRLHGSLSGDVKTLCCHTQEVNIVEQHFQAPTSSPTNSPTSSGVSDKAPPSASGDPHLVNIRGQSFDINRVG